MSKTEFHKSFIGKDFFQLIELKESILDNNEFSYDICGFLKILNLQLCRLENSAYTTENISKIDISKEYDELTKLYECIENDIKRLEIIENIETKKFHLKSNHVNNLNSKLDSIAVRIYQIQFEASLPKIDYPPLYMYTPKEWCKIVEDKVLSCEDPYSTALKIRLNLDRIENESIHFHRMKIVKGEDKFFNGIKNESQEFSKGNYIDEIDNLINFLPDVIEKNNREEKIARLKNSIIIENSTKFKKCVKFMVDRSLIQFNYSEINWLIFSLSSNSGYNFESELPKSSISVDTHHSLHDVRMIFQYMLSHGYIKYEVANHLGELLSELISSSARGNSFASWIKNISNSNQKMRTINFKNSNLTYMDFHSFILY